MTRKGPEKKLPWPEELTSLPVLSAYFQWNPNWPITTFPWYNDNNMAPPTHIIVPNNLACPAIFLNPNFSALPQSFNLQLLIYLVPIWYIFTFELYLKLYWNYPMGTAMRNVKAGIRLSIAETTVGVEFFSPMKYTYWFTVILHIAR